MDFAQPPPNLLFDLSALMASRVHATGKMLSYLLAEWYLLMHVSDLAIKRSYGLSRFPLRRPELH